MIRLDEEILKLALIKVAPYYYHEACDKHLSNRFMKDKLYFPIIFSHDFAKAYWGEEIICEYCGDGVNNYPCRICSIEPQNTPMYIYQLGEMAKEKEPLKYLEKYL